MRTWRTSNMGEKIGDADIQVYNDKFTANLTEVATSLGSTLGAILGQGNVGLQFNYFTSTYKTGATA